jgi:hypothetical protein
MLRLPGLKTHFFTAATAALLRSGSCEVATVAAFTFPSGPMSTRRAIVPAACLARSGSVPAEKAPFVRCDGHYFVTLGKFRNCCPRAFPGVIHDNGLAGGPLTVGAASNGQAFHRAVSKLWRGSRSSGIFGSISGFP